MLRAYITGVAGPDLTDAERHLFKQAPPCGLILFARNCISHDQIRRLVDDVRNLVGTDILVLIDQEGGRVQRLRPPLGRALPPGRAYAGLFKEDQQAGLDAARYVSRLIARDLKQLGINTNCTPVADLPVAGADLIIGDRALGDTPAMVAQLANAIAEGFIDGGVLPVVKHIPGHGRAGADSHLALPVIETDAETLKATDFAPFKDLRHQPAAMTAHVVFTAFDCTAPASVSKTVTDSVIRGWIGFQGLLMSDDLSMKALAGSMASRAQAVIAAGSDIALHCNGDLAEMSAVAEHVPELTGNAFERFERALGITRSQGQPFDIELAETLLNRLLAQAGGQAESV